MLEELEDHEAECPYRQRKLDLVKCNACGEVMPRECMDEHRMEHELTSNYDYGLEE